MTDLGPTALLLGGEWRDAAGGATMPVIDPASELVITHVADAGAQDGKVALDAAVRAQGEWARTAPRLRADILHGAYETLLARTAELAELMTLEMGKPLAEAAGEVRYGAEFFRWFAEEATRIDGGYTRTPDGSTRALTLRQPVGPCLLITPWNFPLAMATRKIGPAIAAGCTMILKPAPQTPLTSLFLAEVLLGAGLPAGVLNVLTTSDAGAVVRPLLQSGEIRKLSFTGSTATGRILLEQSAPAVVRTSMELGGNAPFLVFADADLDRAVDGAMAAKMRNMGEACTAANRFLVHRDIAGDFGAELAERMSALVVGPGREPGVQVGPLIDGAARDKVARLVADAVGIGAEVLTGGDAPAGPGFFYRPTVLTGVGDEAALNRTEIFGPVAALRTFTTDEEVVTIANDTEWGLAAYVYTQDVDRALTVCEDLRVGMVGLNQGIVSNPATPFGGVKQSGLGREGGRAGIEEYLDQKLIAMGVR